MLPVPARDEPPRELRGRQGDVVRSMLTGRDDIIYAAATGSGNSLPYQAVSKILKRRGIAKCIVLIVPLVSIMNDQKRRAEAVGLTGEIINNETSDEERFRIIELVSNGNVDQRTQTLLQYISTSRDCISTVSSFDYFTIFLSFSHKI